MQDFTYYNHNNRLIRVHESDLTHFRDITPYSENPLNMDVLKKSYLKWRHSEEDNGDWVFVGTYNFSIDNDEFMKMYNSFKGVADFRKPKKQRTAITPELIRAINAKIKRGDTVYNVAQFFKISPHTGFVE